MEQLDSQAITLPTLPRTERSAAFLKVLQEPITAEELANLLQSASEPDCAFAIIATWCQKNPEKVFPKPEKESVGSWEMLVELLLKKACRTIIYAAEEHSMSAFYDAVGQYTQALSKQIVRELRILHLRSGFRGAAKRVLANILQFIETKKGRELALSRSFQTLEIIRAATIQTMIERQSRSQPCSSVLLRFYANIVDNIWTINDESLSVEKRATFFEKGAVFDRVEQVAAKLTRNIEHPPLSIP